MSKIAFPSDIVTAKEMRLAQPDLFTQEYFVHLHGDQIRLLSAISLEELLAQKAYAAAAGLPDPYPDEDRSESIRWLNDDYAEYGLSSGLRHTRELVRGFEREAVQQAKAAIGQTR